MYNFLTPRKYQQPHLIVNLKLLNDTEIQKHPQRGGDHGVIVQGEVIKVELVDAQLDAQGDLSCLQGGEDTSVNHTAPARQRQSSDS